MLTTTFAFRVDDELGARIRRRCGERRQRPADLCREALLRYLDEAEVKPAGPDPWETLLSEVLLASSYGFSVAAQLLGPDEVQRRLPEVKTRSREQARRLLAQREVPG